MFVLRGLLVVGLSLAVAATVAAAPYNARRQRHNNGIEGTVVQVHRNRLHRNTGWIKIRRGNTSYYARRRGNSALAAASRRYGTRRGVQTIAFNVNSSTRFQRLGVQGRGSARVGFGSIHRGERVRVFNGGSQGAMRVVDILPNTYHRARRNYAYRNRNGSNYGRSYGYNGYPRYRYNGYPHYGYNRNALVGSRYLGMGSRPLVVVNRPVAIRSVNHPLIQGQVAARRNRQVVGTPVVNRKTTNNKPMPKHTVAHQSTTAKQTVAHKPTTPKHTTTHKSSSNRGHSHSSSHRKK